MSEVKVYKMSPEEIEKKYGTWGDEKAKELVENQRRFHNRQREKIRKDEIAKMIGK